MSRLGPRGLLRHIACFGVWCAVATALFGDVAVRGRGTFFADHDNVIQSFAWMTKLTRAWRAGEPPLWDFETNSGESFVGELQTAPFYPPHIVLALSGLPVDRATLDRYLVLHFALGAFLMHWMLRRRGLGATAAAVGGLLFAFVGTVGQKAGGQMNIFCGMVWLPGAFECAVMAMKRPLEGFWPLGAGALLAASLLAGHPTPFAYASVAILAAAALLGVAEVPARLATPRAMGVIAIGMGLAAPQLAATFEYMARAYRWVGTEHPISAVGRVPYEVFSRAEILHLSELGTALAPTWGTADGATLFVTIAGLCLALLGVLHRPPLAILGVALAVLGLGVALGAEGGMAWLFYWIPPFGSIREPIRTLFLYQFGVAILAALGTERLARVAWRRPWLGRVLAITALVAVAAEVGAHVDRLYRPLEDASPPESVYRERPAVARLRARFAAEDSVYRLLNGGDVLPENLGNVWPPLRATSGHRATMPREYFDLLETDWSLSAPHWDQLGVRYVVSESPLEELGPPVDTDPYVYERASALPVFQVVSPDGSRRALTTSAVTWHTNSVEIELGAPAQGRLVFAQPSYPGWLAVADGRSRPIVKDGPFFGIELDGRERKVRLAYRPMSVFLGAVVSALMLGFLVRHGLRAPERRRTETAVTEQPFSLAWPSRPRLESAGVAVVLAGFLSLALFRLGSPGLYYDELVFVNAALGGPTDMFVNSRVFGIPVRLMTYLGALKSYLYAPVFAVFGVSELSVRLPAVILTLVTLILAWSLLRGRVGVGWGLAGLAALALDPALVYHVRYDWGPVCLMLLLQALLLWSTLHYLDTGRRAFAALCLAATALGVYDKLNFLWISNAIALAVLVTHRASLRERWLADRRAVAALGAGFVALSLAALVLGVVPIGLGEEPLPRSLVGLGDRQEHIAAVMEDALSGNAVFEFIFGAPIVPRVPIIPFAAAAMGLALLLARGSAHEVVALRRFVALCAVAWACVFLEVSLTPAAGGSHHLMTLWLFPWLGLAGALALVGQRPALRPVAPLAGAVVLGLLVRSELEVHAEYRATLSEPYRGSAPWSPSIGTLARSLGTLPQDTEVQCVDWGLCTQMLALGPAGIGARLVDNWPFYSEADPARLSRFFEEHVRGHRVAFVTFAPGREMFGATRRAFDGLASRQPGAFSTRAFSDPGGPPVVELHFHDLP